MEQEILTPAQKKVIELVASEAKLASFYLTGGTALTAYFLKHRLSDDLDFFSFADPDSVFLHNFSGKVKDTLGAESIRYERLYDRHQFFFKQGENELKVEFAKYPFRQLEIPEERDGVKVDSLRDIAANKLMALLDRFDPKDFVDLFFVLQQLKFKDIRRDAEEKFGVKIDNIFLGGELVKVRRIEALPKVTKPLNVEELKSFFADIAKGVGVDVLRD